MRPSKFDILANEIECQISSGKLGVDGRIPSQNKLAVEFDVSRACASKALKLLRDKGVIAEVPGEGFFTAASAKARPQPLKMLIYLTESDMRTYMTGYDDFGVGTLRGIEAACRKAGMYLIIRAVTPAEMHSLPAIVRDSRACGALARRPIPESCLKAVSALGIPSAYVDKPCHVPGIGCSMMNYLDAYVSIAQRLADAGAKRVTFCYAGAHDYGLEIKTAVNVVKDLRCGFELADMDFAPASGTYDFDQDGELIAACLARTFTQGVPLPDVFVTGSDYWARHLITALAARGAKVPEDTQVIGGIGLAFGRSEEPKISTLAVAPAELGRRAVELVSDMASGAPARVERVPMEYIKMDSCVII